MGSVEAIFARLALACLDQLVLIVQVPSGGRKCTERRYHHGFLID
jgi:hypothetical protein